MLGFDIKYAPYSLVSADMPRPIIFLAGPTASLPLKSWRPEAVLEFEKEGFTGTLIIPETPVGGQRPEYEAQVEWEEQGLNLADVIMFWVPRQLPDLPGLTTNTEWGVWCKSGKVVWGNPPDAHNVRYQRYYARKYGVPIGNTLRETCVSAIGMGKMICRPK